MPETVEDPQDSGELAAVIGQIIDIWSGVLGVTAIDADSHLLDLGATSLNAVRIQARIRAEFGREIELVDFLEYPTPRELAPVVAAAEEWKGTEPWHALDWSGEDDA